MGVVGRGGGGSFCIGDGGGGGKSGASGIGGGVEGEGGEGDGDVGAVVVIVVWGGDFGGDDTGVGGWGIVVGFGGGGVDGFGGGDVGDVGGVGVVDGGVDVDVVVLSDVFLVGGCVGIVVISCVDGVGVNMLNDVVLCVVFVFVGVGVELALVFSTLLHSSDWSVC